MEKAKGPARQHEADERGERDGDDMGFFDPPKPLTEVEKREQAERTAEFRAKAKRWSQAQRDWQAEIAAERDRGEGERYRNVYAERPAPEGDDTKVSLAEPTFAVLCSDCGVMVVSVAMHDAWHRRH